MRWVGLKRIGDGTNGFSMLDLDLGSENQGMLGTWNCKMSVSLRSVGLRWGYAQ